MVFPYEICPSSEKCLPPISRQLFPPSSLRKTPSSKSLRELCASSAKAYITSGCDKLIAKLVRPKHSGAGRPFVNCIQFSPPSAERQIPLFAPCSVQAAKITRRFVG